MKVGSLCAREGGAGRAEVGHTSPRLLNIFLLCLQYFGFPLNILIASASPAYSMVYKFCIINHKSIHDRGMLERNQILERRRLFVFCALLCKYFFLNKNIFQYKTFFIQLQGHGAGPVHGAARLLHLRHQTFRRRGESEIFIVRCKNIFCLTQVRDNKAVRLTRNERRIGASLKRIRQRYRVRHVLQCWRKMVNK